MPWIYLLVASVFEVVFALATNATEGFTKLGPSLLTAAAAAGGIFFLSLALRSLDVGVGYTVWTGIGSVGTVAFGTVVFGEALTAPKVVAFVLIISGVLGLRMADKLAGGGSSNVPPVDGGASDAGSSADRAGVAA
ncbi:MAG TPA: multidrug efflux SMR transporter [Nocardia sp.]|uniref:DMT family transporter n=1 Tax=Nocardia sp. TaxID=1821 RepID=UPI002B4B4405|nr:multidrug efflux SMR transporter [Nocardia sp.]HLS79439.1 multidrug efflux SMR transporter [Nocardia sp.]